VAELFMKASGTDGDGGPSSEFTLFSSAMAALEPGDILTIRNGTYTPSTNGRPTIIGGSTADSGTPSNRITVRAENLGQAIITTAGVQTATLTTPAADVSVTIGERLVLGASTVHVS
jgi:hypothetical protein